MDARMLIKTVTRRRSWLFGRLNWRKAWNLVSATKDFALKHETVNALPTIVKIDISPLCNLRCTACVHAAPNGNELLEAQEFHPKHKMTIEQYTRIIDEIKGKSSAVSLYYLGDPLVHPDLDQMSRIAVDAGLEVHISTNFSFGLSDDRLRSIVNSGLTHLTVCIDGLTQEKYQRTRVGGNIERVIKNLERLCRIRKELGLKNPIIEAQYIKYQHNEDEEDKARQLCKELGVDEFATFWGCLDNWAGRDPKYYEVHGPRPAGRLPKCYWPHFSTVIKWNGEVIPCCTFRQGTQYVPGADQRVFGNVYEKSLTEIWNSEEYRRARRLISDPTASERDPSLKNHFCDACPVLFDTTYSENTAYGNKGARFEDLYVLNEKGKPVPKTAAVARQAGVQGA
jgi:MoaA/NifB/PqqE/SkfB family radical SAM enzyme